MARYVWDRASMIFRDRRTGQPMPIAGDNAVCMPMICSDIPEYRSPIDGRPITSRSQRREDLRRHDCYEMDPPKPRGFKNKRFATKFQLPT